MHKAKMITGNDKNSYVYVEVN